MLWVDFGLSRHFTEVVERCDVKERRISDGQHVVHLNDWL